MRLNENVDLAVAATIAQGSFLCGQLSGGCAACHPSCTCDAENKCTACVDSTNASLADLHDVCVCDDTMGGLNYHSSCGSCDGICDTCFMSSDPNSCKICRLSLEPDFLPALCQTCTGSCNYCVYSKCWSELETVDFVNYVEPLYDLPINVETAEGFMCFFSPHPQGTAACSFDEVVTGTIEDYDLVNAAKPSNFQCYEVLRATWPYVIHWFKELFPTFQGPAGASDSEKASIKFTIYLWILQFGGFAIKTEDWNGLRTAINAEPGAWANYLG